MSPGDRANLSRRRSSFRRFPSGEAQYFAAGNHPASPACFLFVMRIGHFRRVELFIIVNPTFSFSPISLTDIKKKNVSLNMHDDTLKTDPACGSGHRVGAERNTAVQNAPNSPLKCAAVVAAAA